MIMGRRKNIPTIDQIDAARGVNMRSAGVFTGATLATGIVAAAFLMVATPSAQGGESLSVQPQTQAAHNLPELIIFP